MAFKKSDIKYVYYTDGVKNVRLSESAPQPEGFRRGRTTRQLTPEEQQRANEARAKTSLERYGDAHYNNPDKYKKTCLEKYGLEFATQAESTKEHIKEANLAKYGVENVFQSEEVKSQIKATMQARYGVDYASQSQLHKENVKATWQNKTPEEQAAIVDKRMQTSYERYGKKLYSCTDEAAEKTRNTCMERYGVPYYCMTDDCRSYSGNNSKPNKKFAEKLDELGIAYEREFVIDRKSYDFKIGDILVEINPTITHNSTISAFGREPMSKNYHHDKSELARDSGYRCIHVWDWDDPDQILRLLQPREKAYARNCSIKEVSQKDKTIFIDEHHLQHDVRSEINLGLYWHDELISVMTFGAPRYNKSFQYELLRFCSSKAVIGGAEKLFKHFLHEYAPDSIISYCDLSKFSGKTYDNLGFKLIGTSIGRHWYSLKEKRHITDNLLRQRGFDQLFGTAYGKGTDNAELMKSAGYLEVYDAGQAKYAWQKSDTKMSKE